MQTPRNTEAPITEYMLIDGKLVDGTERIEVRNPARPDELVGTIVRGTPAHVDEAVAAAKARQLAWAGLTFTERAGTLRKALSRLEADIDRRAGASARRAPQRAQNLAKFPSRSRQPAPCRGRAWQAP